MVDESALNSRKKELFKDGKILIGMIHLPALPGSPLYTGQDIDDIINHAREDLSALLEGGISSVMIENYGDAPFCRGKIPRETMASMSIVVREISRSGGQRMRSFGVNVLRNDWEAAIAIAAAVKADFIRVNVLTGVAVTDQGIIQGEAYDCLNYRKRVHPDLKILADIFVKHSTP
ncbi:MAG: BtpA/SgcQ family protein, partial [Candidatus Hodarchaeales archaeon]